MLCHHRCIHLQLGVAKPVSVYLYNLDHKSFRPARTYLCALWQLQPLLITRLSGEGVGLADANIARKETIIRLWNFIFICEWEVEMKSLDFDECTGSTEDWI